MIWPPRRTSRLAESEATSQRARHARPDHEALGAALPAGARGSLALLSARYASPCAALGPHSTRPEQATARKGEAGQETILRSGFSVDASSCEIDDMTNKTESQDDGVKTDESATKLELGNILDTKDDGFTIYAEFLSPFLEEATRDRVARLPSLRAP
jgi:hypothetical protein